MRVLRAVAFLVLAGVSATPAMAQYGRHRDGRVWSPYGLMYDTRSPEWRMAGGNIYVYQELMQQKALMREQQMLLKQQQAYAKQLQAAQKAQQKNGGGRNGAQGRNAPNGPALAAVAAAAGNAGAPGNGNPARKHTRRAPSGKSTTASGVAKAKTDANADLADDPVTTESDPKAATPARGEATRSANPAATPKSEAAQPKSHLPAQTETGSKTS